ncbi:ferrochelatase [Fodinicurvata halophila]|uniref:Ferrochelatase n=1 Tax=Fodinicurvata halophila TaxID=1419723 RepID=A0ABV8UMA0_9PROT
MTETSNYQQHTAPDVLPADHPEVAQGKVGILLVNLGTPDGTDYRSMRRYLSQFLSDRRVIELPRLLWQPLLQAVILSRRPQRSGEAYEKIWNHEQNESPLRTITRRQAEEIAQCFTGNEETAPEVLVDWAMRYGTPSIEDRFMHLNESGCRRILVFPLYPQYSAATTASACDTVYRTMMRLRWQPSLRTAPPYHDEPAYIAALGASIREHLAQRSQWPERILVSFHGLPRENLDKGDPYHCHCQKTARLLSSYMSEHLGNDCPPLQIVFQSRFGPKEWLQPYADVTTADLARQGTKRLAIISPGFAADCVETLEELNIGLRETFLENGGEDFTYIPCLNDSQAHIDMLTGLLRRELAGWI